uniref:cytochrome b n=1 Tax=Dryocosmus liui TaxID=2315263 RepID=UPI0022644D15|nr:cytochrome b [Dryocosmus liui]UEE83324.1 cytochrome b [Dryocosmus liui]
MKMNINSMNLIKKMKKMILMLPTPININILWNFGSLLGICLTIQIITGLFLSMHYTSHINNAFNSIIHIMHDINYGWLMRLIHMNGASFFFFCMFIHIGRGIYFNSYFLYLPWYTGSLIFILTMATAFLGYVLPWGQMSFWGATVITNLMSAIPMVGNNIVIWLWGGFSVNNATLNRFYSLHFIMPFIILMMILIHLSTLHITGSNNPLGTNNNLYKIPFHIYFTIKDIQGFMLMIIILLILCSFYPYTLGDPENFNMANPMITPIHIQPEWYFLFAYAILRSIPNKLGGVIALLFSVMIIMILPLYNMNKFQSSAYYPLNQISFWGFVNIMIMLTWIGMKPIEFPFMMIGQIMTILYFSYYLINPIIFKKWNKMLM